MIAVIILILVILYVYQQYIAPKMNPDYVANKEWEQSSSDSTSGSTSEVDIMMFTADWCPHCKKAKPIWEEFNNTYDGKVINGYKINVKTINCTNDSDPNVQNLLDKYNVEGFPTIKLIKNGEVYDYDAKPDKESLKQFLDTMTN
jgi:thiol-disulfide isomerase/thioredoxin